MVFIGSIVMRTECITHRLPTPDGDLNCGDAGHIIGENASFKRTPQAKGKGTFHSRYVALVPGFLGVRDALCERARIFRELG